VVITIMFFTRLGEARVVQELCCCLFVQKGDLTAFCKNSHGPTPVAGTYVHWCNFIEVLVFLTRHQSLMNTLIIRQILDTARCHILKKNKAVKQEALSRS